MHGAIEEEKKVFFNEKQNSGVWALIHNEWMYCIQLSYRKDFFYLFSPFLFLEQSFKFPCGVPHCSFQSNRFGVVCTCLYSLYSSVCSIYSTRKNI